MNLPFETMKSFDSDIDYKKRIVAFVDVMGMRNRIAQSSQPQDFKMYATILSMFENQPFAEGKIYVSAFSDCMYIIADKEYVDSVICLLANFSHRFLFNNTPTITVTENGIESENNYDCFKLRGGITYGDVYVVDELPEKNGISLKTNIVLGKAVMDAYSLESKTAVFPRIIVDKAFLALLDDLKKSKEQFFLVEENGMVYLDFLDYMCQGKRDYYRRVLYGLPDCIEYVENEIKMALAKNNDKLTGQLLWYKQYLEKHLIQ